MAQYVVSLPPQNLLRVRIISEDKLKKQLFEDVYQGPPPPPYGIMVNG